MYLKDQIAIVTGAARGIGKAIAKKFAAEGAYVVMIGRHKDTLDAVRAEIEAAGGRAESYECDLADGAQIKKTVAAVVAAHKRIDVLVNNAGVSNAIPFFDFDMEEFDRVLAINLRAPVQLMKEVVPIMKAQDKGAVVNIASAAGVRGLPGNSTYAASKAGLIAFTQAVGDELKGTGVRCNVICPGPVATEMFNNDNPVRDFILKAGGDIQSTEVLANTALFLACDELSGVMNSQKIVTRGFNRW